MALRVVMASTSSLRQRTTAIATDHVLLSTVKISGNTRRAVMAVHIAKLRST